MILFQCSSDNYFVYVGYQCADDSIDGQAAEVFEDVFFDEPRTSEGSEEVSEP